MLDKLKNYATQASTWKGIIYFVGALGIYEITPEVQDQLITQIITIVTGLFAVSGVIDIVKDERKK